MNVVSKFSYCKLDVKRTTLLGVQCPGSRGGVAGSTGDTVSLPEETNEAEALTRLVVFSHATHLTPVIVRPAISGVTD